MGLEDRVSAIIVEQLGVTKEELAPIVDIQFARLASRAGDRGIITRPSMTAISINAQACGRRSAS